jgi:hypothetical protein
MEAQPIARIVAVGIHRIARRCFILGSSTFIAVLEFLRTQPCSHNSARPVRALGLP